MPVSDGNSLAELLTEAAQPNIYRINAFRILELTVDCGEMDISRRMRMIEISGKTGAPVPPGPGLALALETPPDNYAYLDAAQRLRAPEQRFIDEFFWFWPHDLGNGKSDEALAVLKQNDIEQAVEIWTNYANNYSVDNVSVHNMAVLSHASALDLETLSATQVLTESQLKKLDIYWRQTFKRWNNLLTQAGFWKRLGARVREFGDPRLDSATVQALHDSLPLGLLLVNARLAVQAAERGDEAGTARHLQTMQLADFGQEKTLDALVLALEPVRARIKTFCKTAETQTESDPVHSDEVASSLLEQCSQPLQVLDRLLPESAPARQATHDEVALRGLACVVAYGNRTEDWRGCVKIMDKIIPVASSPSTRSRLEENLKTQRSNAESGNDWCGEGYYDLPEHILTPLEEARSHFNSRTWDKAIQILDNLLNRKTSPIEEEYKPLVRKPLATCLNLAGNDRVKDALRELDEPRQVIVDLQRTAAHADYAWNRTAAAAQSGTLQSIAQSPGIVCMACGHKIYQRWYTFTFNNLKIVICEDCNSRDDRQMSGRRANVSKALVSFYDDLLYAQELDPTNKSVTENLESVRTMANTLKATLPSRTSRRPGQPPKPAPAASSTSGARSTSTSRPAPAVRPRSTTTSTHRGEPANLGQHFFAWLIDITLIGLVLVVPFSASITDNGNGAVGWLIFLIFLYYPVCFLLFKCTPGEGLLHIRVFNKDGNKVSLGRATARWILYLVLYGVSAATFSIGGLAFLAPMFNKNHKSLPDLILGTCLVKA